MDGRRNANRTKDHREECQQAQKAVDIREAGVPILPHLLDRVRAQTELLEPRPQLRDHQLNIAAVIEVEVVGIGKAASIAQKLFVEMLERDVDARARQHECRRLAWGTVEPADDRVARTSDADGIADREVVLAHDRRIDERERSCLILIRGFGRRRTEAAIEGIVAIDGANRHQPCRALFREVGHRRERNPHRLIAAE